MTLREALREGKKTLGAAGVSGADAEMLLEHVTGLRRVEILTGERSLNERETALYREWLERRASGEPVQYIAGECEFFGRAFAVDPRVLIPRMDTETLAARALALIPTDKPFQVLEIGAGSGCVTVTLAAERQNAALTAADVSPGAVSLGRQNAARYGLENCVVFVESDLFGNISGEFDMIVSNPPYIPSGEIPGLPGEILEHEPLLALDGGPDGLFFYRKIALEAGRHLKPGGFLLFETGHDQAGRVTQILENAGFVDIQTEKDVAGIDRVVWAGKK